MAFVLIVPALEWREAIAWPQPLRFVCFVCAPVSPIPINILALSGQRVRVPHRGSQKCTPSPVPSTFRAQQLFLPACVNGSSYFSFRRRAEAWGGGEELFYPFRDCTIEDQFANRITLPVSQIITVSLLWTRKTEGFTSRLSIPAQVRISWRAFEAHQHRALPPEMSLSEVRSGHLVWELCGWLQAIAGPARNPSLGSLAHWSRPLVLVDLHALLCPRETRRAGPCPSPLHPWF